MHLVVTPAAFLVNCELHRGAEVPRGDYYVYSISLIHLHIGTETRTGGNQAGAAVGGSSKTQSDAKANDSRHKPMDLVREVVGDDAESETKAPEGKEDGAQLPLLPGTFSFVDLEATSMGSGSPRSRVRSVVPKRVSFDAAQRKNKDKSAQGPDQIQRLSQQLQLTKQSDSADPSDNREKNKNSGSGHKRQPSSGDGFVVGGVRVGGIVVGGIMVDEAGVIVSTDNSDMSGMDDDDNTSGSAAEAFPAQLDHHGHGLVQMHQMMKSNPDLRQGRESPGNSSDDYTSETDEFADGFDVNGNGLPMGSKPRRRRWPRRVGGRPGGAAAVDVGVKAVAVGNPIFLPNVSQHPDDVDHGRDASTTSSSRGSGGSSYQGQPSLPSSGAHGNIVGGHLMRREANFRRSRKGSSMEQAASSHGYSGARSIGSSASFDSNNDFYDAVGSNSRNNSGSAAASEDAMRRHRELSGQGEIGEIEATERAARAKTILLQPLFRYELDYGQFEELTGKKK